MLRLDWNLLFTVINLLVLYFLLKKFLFKPIENILAKRQELVDSQLGDAENAKKDAEKLKQQYETTVLSSESEGKAIIERAHQDARNEYDRIINEAKLHADDIVSKASQQAQNEKQKIISEAKKEITALAVIAASKIIADADENANSRIYDKFLTKVGEEK